MDLIMHVLLVWTLFAVAVGFTALVVFLVGILYKEYRDYTV